MFCKCNSGKRPGQRLGAMRRVWKEDLLSVPQGLALGHHPHSPQVPRVTLLTERSPSLGILFAQKSCLNQDYNLSSSLRSSPHLTSLMDWCGIEKAQPPCFSSDQPWVALLAPELHVNQTEASPGTTLRAFQSSSRQSVLPPSLPQLSLSRKCLRWSLCLTMLPRQSNLWQLYA